MKLLDIVITGPKHLRTRGGMNSEKIFAYKMSLKIAKKNK